MSKKTPMTEEAAKRIEKAAKTNLKNDGFPDRANKAAKKNKKK